MAKFGRRAGFRSLWTHSPCGFKSHPAHSAWGRVISGGSCEVFAKAKQGNQRVFAYKDSGAVRWRCDLDFGNSASGWEMNSAAGSAVIKYNGHGE